MVTVLLSFASLSSYAKDNNHVQNYHGGYVGHGVAHSSHVEYTGTHGEHSHHESHRENDEHASLSGPDDISFYPEFSKTVSPFCNTEQQGFEYGGGLTREEILVRFIINR
ncbi:MAG: hypothetical protein AB8W37_05850 [Arsenophonus endosymbiont of Dermacentor nuttalli]